MPITEQAHAPAGQANEDLSEGHDLQMPDPLLPHQEHRDDDLTQRVALRPISSPSAARQAVPAMEETTEVHVTIGRIEVTAVQTTPAQKPPPRRRQAPLSLDEYIARRQEGRT
jgi:hypothetical protein